MPIRPEMKSKYPPKKEWAAIRAEVLARAKNACEWEDEHGRCGAPDRATIYWDGECWIRLSPSAAEVAWIDGEKVVLIVLTIAHIDQNPENNGVPGNRPNLKALCQRHHNRLDAPHRAAGIRARRNEKAGQTEFLDGAGNVIPTDNATGIYPASTGRKT